MKLLRRGNVIAEVSDKLQLKTTDADIRQLFKEFKENGLSMRIPKSTKVSITETVETVPFSPEYIAVLADNLQDLGFEIQY